MSVIVRSIQLDASPARAWEALADFGGIARWNPNVSESRSTSAANGGVGATRHCDVKGGSIEERILDWQDGRSLVLEIYEAKGSPSAIKRAVATFTVDPAGRGSLVTATLDFKLKFGPLGAVMSALVARRQFARSFEQLLAGLQEHLATGEPIAYGRTLAFTPAAA